MTNHQEKYQPGIIFHDVFQGGLRALGSSGRKFAAETGTYFQNLRAMATGHINGPTAKEVRNQMIEAVGPDLFDVLYRARLEKERGEKGVCQTDTLGGAQ